MSELIDVCIPNTHHNYFTYDPGHWTPAIGARVWIPFREKIKLGIVTNTQSLTKVAPSRIKTIAGIIDETPLLDQAILQLCHWVSDYYQAPLSEVLPLALPKHFRDGAQPSIPSIDCYQLHIAHHEALAQTPPRARKQCELINWLSECPVPVSRAAIQEAGFQLSILKMLCDKGLVRHTLQPIIETSTCQQTKESPLQLNIEQRDAFEKILPHLDSHQRFLLHGVTGSGKTEIYLQTIAETLQRARQVLVIVPEIGLTPQLLARFKSRFNAPMAVIHSHLNEQQRQFAWYQAATGKAKIIIGTRTAIFTPLPNLGLIVIDEEHDASLKQMDGVRYSARDTALMRAQMANIPIILGSATPSLESLYNCEQQKFTLLPIHQQAMTSIPLKWTISDLRNVRLQEGLSPNTLSAIQGHLNQGNQVLVFINRRGFSPVLLCHQCGWIADCPACDSHLTLHRQANRLICHHCGSQRSLPNTCHKCHSTELIPVGTGTQRLEECLQKQFPTTPLIRIDRDEVRKKDELTKRLKQIYDEKAQLIIGTQMMAKGHHFPRLTLVVVVEADTGFYNQDFRAIERLGQLLTQVAGRAGRAEHPGEVIIQTHFPKHPLLNTLIQRGYRAFADELLEARAKAELPPHHYLAMIRAQSRHPKKVLHFLQQIKKQLHPNQQTKPTPTLTAHGPAPAPLARKANQHRMQLLIKSSSRKQLQNTLTQLRQWVATTKLDANIRWHIDVDPIDMS